MYRDLAAALERVDRLEAENADLRALSERRPTRWLDGVVFGLLVAAGATVILVGSWLLNAS